MDRIGDNHGRIALLLIGALLVRLGWVWHLSANPANLVALPDQVEYLQLGKNLIHTGELQFVDLRFNATVRAYRTPGYPLLVAFCGGEIRVIQIVQVLIDTSTVMAAYLLARRWLSARASLLAGFAVAANPFLIYFCGLVLSETLSIAMLAWGMALLAGSRWRPALAGIVLLALAVLVRPSAMFLPIVLTSSNWRRLAVAIAAIVLVLVPWAARNHMVLGRWVWTTTNSGITQYDGFNPSADGSSNQKFVETMPELQRMSEVERSDYLLQQAREFARNHPLKVVQLTIRKIMRTWSPVPLSDEYGGRRLYVFLAAAYSVPLDLLVLWALWSGTLPRAAKVYLIAPALYFTAVHAMSVGSLRYRIPAEVPMGVLAVSSFDRRTRQRESE